MDEAGLPVASGSYPRSTGSARGQARQQELLAAVTHHRQPAQLADALAAFIKNEPDIASVIAAVDASELTP